MADELTVRTTLEFLKGSVDDDFSESAILDVTGTKCVKNVQSIGNAAEALYVGDMTTPGYMAAKNLDATNYVEIRDGADGADLVKLLAGELALFRLATNAPYAISNSSVSLKYMVVEN